MRQRKERLSLSTQILIGLVLGIATRRFFGENAGALAIVGRGCVGLLQECSA